MVNLKWDVYNMLTIWLMVAIMYVAIGFAKSMLSGAASDMEAA